MPDPTHSTGASQPISAAPGTSGFSGAVSTSALTSFNPSAYQVVPVSSSTGAARASIAPSRVRPHQPAAVRPEDRPALARHQFDAVRLRRQPIGLTAADVTVQSVSGIDYGPITIVGSGTTYSIMFAHPIEKADRVTLTVTIPDTERFAGRLNVLPGDVNGDGVVNSTDLSTIRKEWRGKHASQRSTATSSAMARSTAATSPRPEGPRQEVAQATEAARQARHVGPGPGETASRREMPELTARGLACVSAEPEPENQNNFTNS